MVQTGDPSVAQAGFADSTLGCSVHLQEVSWSQLRVGGLPYTPLALSNTTTPVSTTRKMANATGHSAEIAGTVNQDPGLATPALTSTHLQPSSASLPRGLLRVKLADSGRGPIPESLAVWALGNLSPKSLAPCIYFRP